MTTTAKLDKWNPDASIILRAAEIINSGGLVAFPTETVYGLGADALNPEAVSKIYKAKGRPSDNPLILHVHTIAQAEELVFMNETAYKLAKIFWPGPLTFVLPAKNVIPLKTRGNLETAAIRMPDNPIALALIEASGTPLAAPSANLSGRPSPTDAMSVYQDMNGRIDFILDGGSVEIGIESTVIDLTNPEKILMLRPGGMSREIIEQAVKMKLQVPDNVSKKRSPGTRYKHYSPAIPVKLLERNSVIPANSGYMGLNDFADLNFADKIIFDSIANYAHGLFSGFRKFEREKLACIFVERPEENSGISEGLLDRILRASSNYV